MRSRRRLRAAHVASKTPRRSCINQFEMVFSAFDDSFTLHFPQLFRHICSFQIEIISKLLPVKGDVKFHGVFLQGNGIKI